MIATTQEELAALREGGRRLARYLGELAALVAPGVRTSALEEEARKKIIAGGDEPAFLGYRGRREKHPYPAALCVSINDVIVHSPASDNGRTIEDGDVVCLDFGVKHKGLYTDHAITIIAGEPRSEDDVRLVVGTKEALAAGIKAARMGKTTGDIGHAVERVAKKYGFGFPRNLSGHGVGRAIHEEPHVPNFGAPGSGEKLVEGLVIAIEPMMTLGTGELVLDEDGHGYRTKDGSRTAHFEHTVLVTKNGPEVLTGHSR
ncbi:type I methionyl aminopeptidase [Candidatus Kaiserbacteria bacterium CG10_big_fil_rev_8_21_14_0_10_59_10]|uniref:Methionine aminopeptidase n=1 Tax=Candidatus Kaiserbacteria bacterium CG10_big_fil_rev_8_21_14_0_10_59_10 TaxID=1974612 RepID=A0A2H0UAS5_9BACT|nr:MAG: type I methionyl aminopeptidase [Candidatus Kaiserbacteria bacterium CG10_big_fil_rev_8_21_14_0_10_59_10]